MPAINKRNARFRKPKCRECGSTDISATSSQQIKMIGGRKRQAADAVCANCGHTWWSVNPVIRALARKQDVERKVATLRSGTKERVLSRTKRGRQVRAAGEPRGLDMELDVRRRV